MKRYLKYFACVLLVFFFSRNYAQLQINGASTGNKSAPTFIQVQQGGNIQPSSNLFIAPSSANQSTTNGANQGGSLSPVIDFNRPVGTMEGSASVGQNGSVNYGIQIELPPGTNNMTPKTGLAYNSNSGDGMLGMGWYLQGTSVIKRVNKDIYHDGVTGSVKLEADDAFSFDGNRMFSTCGSLGGGCVYRLENENFTKVTYMPGGYFLAQTKDGTFMEYGNTSNSKVTLKNATNDVDYEFYLNKVYDNFDNYISYEYYNDAISKEVVLKNIAVRNNF